MDMVIRDAVFEDFELLLPLAREAHMQSIFAGFEMNEAIVQRNFVTTMAFDDGFAKVAVRNGVVVGGLLGAISENQFGVRCASDLFNYSLGGTDRLVKEFKAWAKSRDAKFMHLTDMSGNPRFQRLICNLGFQPSGLNFVEVL